MHDPAEQALRELRRLDRKADAMGVLIERIIFQPGLRRKLMTAKDDIKAGIQSATAKVVAVKARIQTLLDRITELEAMPGPWTDEDIAEIKTELDTLNSELDTTVA